MPFTYNCKQWLELDEKDYFRHDAEDDFQSSYCDENSRGSDEVLLGQVAEGLDVYEGGRSYCHHHYSNGLRGGRKDEVVLGKISKKYK